MATEKNYFSIVDSNNIKGGLYQVDNYIDLFKYNAASHFKDGMLCYVTKHDKYYQYWAKKKRWYPVNIERLPIIDSSILIDNQWYDIAKMDSYDALLQELIQLKYSKDWQANHDMNMRKYAPIYQQEENEFQEWVTKCKQAAWLFFFGNTYPNTQEADNENIFDYPYIKALLDDIQSNIDYLQLQLHDLSVNLICMPDGDAIEYTAQDSYEIKITGIASRDDKQVPIIYNKLIDPKDNTVLWDNSIGLENYSYIKKKKKNGEYNFQYIATDNLKQKPIIIDKKVIFTIPYYYGASKRNDISYDNQPTHDEYKEQIYRLVRNFVESNTEFILNPYKSQNVKQYIRDWNIDYYNIEHFIENTINTFFSIDYDLTPSKYYKIRTIDDLLETLASYIEQYNHDKFINGYKTAGFKEYDKVFYNLIGTEEGIKHLKPQEKLTINIPTDGYYIWLCLPYQERIQIPEVWSNGQYFPLADDYIIMETIYGKNVCFRSIGEKGLEAHTLKLEIKYDTSNYIELN